MRRIALFAAPLALLAQSAPEILRSKCAGCHNEKNRTSGLSLESADSIRAGGNRGPGHIVSAIRHTGDLKMPPGAKLAEADIAAVDKWIADGMPGMAASTAPRKGAGHWAFQPVKRPTPPSASTWARNEVDRFVLAKMATVKLKPSPEADKSTLLRRVSFDLTGLPPTPAEVDAFLADPAADAYERVVERLLASRHYGERWARHWLDQARYADSDGGSRDEPRQIWKYREWVIDAINKDQPFDQFVTEQLAGDLIPNAKPEQIIATGFQRNSLLQIEAGTDREQYRTEAVSDRVDTFGAVFLGLATGCARCHDHKFDPISQREYYQLYSFFNNIDEYGPAVPPFSDTNDLEVTHQPMLALGKPGDTAKHHALRAQILALYKERFEYKERMQPKTNDAGLAARNETIAALKKQLPKVDLTMVMRELPEPREAYIHLGGDFLRKGAPVTAALPTAFHAGPAAQPAKRLTRLDLARWVVDPANPLLARVTANRIWSHYFGRGIVETENDFGTQGAKPTHPELLDWLAAEFVAKGWSQKAMHRLIVTSAAYRQSSRARSDVDKADPRNLLLARQNRLRLDAEIVRDASLAASGLLVAKVGGPSVFPPQPEHAMDASQVKKTWRASKGDDRFRRGMYTHFYRITPHPALVVFDQPNGMIACTRRARTTTPLQALTLLNDAAFHELAQGLATRIVKEAPSAGDARIDHAFRLCMSRAPESAERDRLRRLLAVEADDFRTNPAEAEKLTGTKDPDLAAWTALARVLLNTDEFITRE